MKISICAEKLVLNNFFIATTATVGVLAGLSAGLYTAEIRNSFPLSFYCISIENIENCEVKNEVFTSWLLIVLFWIMFYLTGRFQSSKTRSYEEKLEAKTDELLSQTSTMPPKGFLNLYLRSHSESANEIAKYFRKSCLKVKAAEQIDGFLPISKDSDSSRLLFRVLADVANLALKFDNSPENVKYEVNLMVFRAMDSFDKSDYDKILNSCSFVESNQDPKKLSGLLEIIPGIKCAAVANSQGIIDLELTADESPTYQLILPIHPGYVEDNSELCFRNFAQLPGAPELCYVDRPEVAYYASIDALNKSLKERRDFREEIEKLVDDYFSDYPEIQSFASIPIFSDLFSEKVDDSEVEFFGVLNIHSNKNNVLGSYKRAFELFMPLLVSYMPFLAVYLNQRAKAPLLLKDGSHVNPI